jgi:prephenate dehydrogenase
VKPAKLFGTVVVAGVGLIGGSIALSARQRFVADRVIGLDPDGEALEVASFHGVIDAAYTAPGAWLQEADLVVLATPSRRIAGLLEEIEPFLREDALVTDVGSVKAQVARASTRPTFVPGHPMAGSDRAGVQHADAALLENAVWVLTPTEATREDAIARVEGFVETLGARPVRLEPEQHDRLVATVSHVPYVTAVALTRLATGGGEADWTSLLAAGGFRDLTRVASGSPVMSRDMVVANSRAVADALDGLIGELETLKGQLGDAEAFGAVALAAKQARDAIPVVRRSVLSPRPEVVLAVPDTPGQLMRITAACGEANVNIKEIEVLSIREAGGAVRLAFEDQATLERAVEALSQAGFEARQRPV